MLPTVALLAGAALGMRSVFLPVPLAFTLVAAGVALGRRAGLVVAAFAAGLLAVAVAAGPPAVEEVDADRPVELVGRVAGHWAWNGETWSAPLRVRRVVQDRRVVVGRGGQVRLSLSGLEAPPPFGSRLRVRGHLRRSSGYANALPVEPGPWRLHVKSRRLLEVEAAPGRLAALAADLRCRVEAAQAAAVRLARTRAETALPETALPEATLPEATLPEAAAGHPGTSGASAPRPCAYEPLDPARLEPGPALVRALVLGDTAAVPPPWRRGLRRTGLAHVLAVSGLHVGLVAAAALLLAAPLRPPLARLPVALLAVGLYLLVAGPRPALLRATLMAALAAAALLARRPPVAGNALAVTVALLVLHRPALVEDLGFRLSAAATAGLVFLAPPAVRRARAVLAEWAGRQPATAVGRLRELPARTAAVLVPPLGAAVAAQLASSPFALPAFHLLSLTSPLSNLVAVPWTAVTLAAGLGWSALAMASASRAATLLPWLDRFAAPFGWPALGGPEAWGTVPVLAPAGACWFLVALTGGCLHWSLSMPPTDARRGAPGRLLQRRFGPWLPWIVLVLGASLLAPVVRWGWGGRPAAGGGGSGDRVAVTVLDVGQGDAVLLRDGERAVLVDGGGWRRGDLGGRVLLPALLGEGVDRLEAVVLTHADRDHCGGLVDLASYLPMGQVWTAPGWQHEGCGAELVAAAVGEEPLGLRLLAAGDEGRVGRWRFTALHPAAEEGGPAQRLRATRRAIASSRRNDHSLVLHAEALGRQVLLTGDVEAAAERAMVRRAREGREPPLRSDFLKVAHHGSRSSSGVPFLRATAPRLAVVSVGRHNLYHHPAPEVVERYRRLGIPLLRTDRDGAIRLSWTGPEGLWITTGR